MDFDAWDAFDSKVEMVFSFGGDVRSKVEIVVTLGIPTGFLGRINYRCPYYQNEMVMEMEVDSVGKVQRNIGAI